MSRVLAAHQPNYLPWLGLFYKLGQADVWVIGDDVQYTRHGLTNRNRIRTAAGWQWLTVPVLTRGRGPQLIGEVEVDTTRTWQRKHWQALQWNYQSAAFFEIHAAFLEVFYRREWHLLAELNVEFCQYLLRQFNIEVEVHRSSELNLRQERTLRLVDMAMACGCDVYLAGTGGSRAYLDEKAFHRAGIECRFTDFRHPIYAQCFPGFEPNMTALDLLLNCGEASREVLFA